MGIFKNQTLRTKISRTMIIIVIAILLCVGTVTFLSMRDLSEAMIASNREIGITSSRETQSAMTETTRNSLLELARNKASVANQMFLNFQKAVSIAASAAEKLYADENLYPKRMVARPAMENNGKLAVQALFASDTDPDDPKIVKELLLMGNIQDTLLSINNNYGNMASNYIATESGIMIQADYISAMKFDESGNIMPLDAKERPWYIGASETGKAFFTSVTEDLHTGRLGIMCGVPIYRKGWLMGVSGAGMYLDDVNELVQSIDLGENGDACIVNREGQIIFSTCSEGMFSATEEREDLRTGGNAALATIIERSLSGKSGVELLVIDGVQRYVAYAPMKTVDWAFFILLSQQQVRAPALRLRSRLEEMTTSAIRDANLVINRSVMILLGVFLGAIVITLLISNMLSKRIVRPIQSLTETVRGIEGDRLDFEWNMDTGDETQMLAASFQSLTQRMKEYIRDIRDITAERERMGTELDIAARIQESMLPSEFPPFPDRNEFDLYALMDPAKEVGGDFYDYYFIDDDHLGIVIADVSGKGVPAALFMMASKIIISDNAKMNKSPAEVLAETNATLSANNRAEMFVTVWLGVLEVSTGKLTAANAGHEYPALKKPDGTFELVKDRHGFVIGGMPGMRYREYELQLEPGSKLFVYTDGVPEATNEANELFGTDRMLAALNSDPGAGPEDVLDNVRRAVDGFVGKAPQFDDMTMLCLEYKGKRQG